MNRRTFLVGAAAGTALLGNQVAAQRSGRSSSVLTSELTGGEVDASDSGLVLLQQHIDDADGSEHFHFEVEGGQFDIVYWPHSSGDAANFVDAAVDMFTAIIPDSEEIGAEVYDDGGWIAIDATVIAYYEYQLGAYGDHDLIVSLTAPAESYADAFDQAQAIMIDGMEPFLFSEDSQILTLVEDRAAATTSTSRTSRSSRSSSTSNENETGNTSQTRSSQSGTGDPVQAVLDHRATFVESYEEHYAQIEIMADEASTDLEVEEAFMLSVNVALEWQTYPTQASEVAFTPDLAELEAVYLDWANAIGEMGILYEQFWLGEATVDDYLAAHDVWIPIDDELLAILETLGTINQNQIARQLNVLRISSLRRDRSMLRRAPRVA